MEANLFYNSDTSTSAVPLVLISQKDWKIKLVADELNHLEIQQFEAKPNSVGLITNSEAKLVKVLVAYETKAELNLATAALSLPPGNYSLSEEVSDFAIESWALAQYSFTRYKKKELKPRILELDKTKKEQIISKVQAIYLIRDLINTPACDLGPKQLGEAVANIASKYKASYKEWVDGELLTANFPAIHAVGKGAANRPRLLSFTWGSTKHPRIAIIGKGVCFDSGGLDIKTNSNMRIMKKDMGGAAHALALAEWIMQQNLEVHLELLIPAVENLIGPDSYKPDDIIIMRSGLSVEVDNTDAEGRLVLADAITKAEESSPDLIIDYATLTGAAKVALGTDFAVMFTNDDLLAKDLEAASLHTRDPIWRLPLYKPYASLLDSSIADLTNASAVPYGGAITAALFLERFVRKTKSWVHFDMMAWNLSSKPGRPEGGEAMAFRAMTHYLQKKYG